MSLFLDHRCLFWASSGASGLHHQQVDTFAVSSKSVFMQEVMPIKSSCSLLSSASAPTASVQLWPTGLYVWDVDAVTIWSKKAIIIINWSLLSKCSSQKCDFFHFMNIKQDAWAVLLIFKCMFVCTESLFFICQYYASDRMAPSSLVLLAQIYTVLGIHEPQRSQPMTTK